MALKKYIGARYTPKFMGAWDAQTVYAALSVVYANEQSYVSRKTVPAGTELSNTEYWVKSADWNAQVAEYNRNVENYNKNVVEYNKNVVAYEQAVNTFYADTLHSYDTKAAMVADQDLKLGDTLLTCGNTAIGDGGGSFYQVVAETSAKAVALENGLYALPFEFQPYDYSEFQTEVDNYKNETDAQVAEIKRVSLHTYDNEEAMKADTTIKPNTTLLTTGKGSVGDNLGSFWRTQETSADPTAVELNNGIKAVPFQLNATTLGGSAMTFAGKSEATGVWNVIAPATITIPLTVPQDRTQMTYLGVLYGKNQATVTAKVVVNNQTKTLTLSDKADTGTEKFVVYAITCKNTDVLYWGYSVAASWTTKYQYDKVSFSTKLGKNAPLAPSNTAGSGILTTPSITITPSRDITLESFIYKQGNTNATTGNQLTITTGSSYPFTTVFKRQDFTANANSVVTIPIDVVLKANTDYDILLTATNSSAEHYYWTSDEGVSDGTYDLLKVTNPPAGVSYMRMNCVLNYNYKA